MKNYLVYSLDVRFPLCLTFRVLDFDSRLMDYFLLHKEFIDDSLNAAVISASDLSISLPGERTMGFSQCIKGFAGYNKTYTSAHTLVFNSDKDRDEYVEILNRLLSGMVVELRKAHNEVLEGNPRIQIYYKL